MCFPQGTISEPGYDVDGNPASPETARREAAKAMEKAGVRPPPDITSELLDATTRTEKSWARTKRGRRSTFLTGQTADSTMTPPPSTLLGG
jgi:hypothetical protein